MYVTYYTRANRSRPFKVKIENNRVEVYRYKQLVVSTKAIRVFVGRSPLTKMTSFSCGSGPTFDGNTILLQVGDNEYMFIGSEVFTFSTKATVIDYISEVGNNEVPYPYALDNEGNYYLLTENVVLKHTPELHDQIKSFESPYCYYYKASFITSDRGYVVPKKPMVEKFKGICKFWIDDERFTMRYTPHPAKDYDTVIPSLGKQMKVTKENKRTVNLSKNKYIQIIMEFGNLMSFEPLSKIKILHHRL